LFIVCVQADPATCQKVINIWLTQQYQLDHPLAKMLGAIPTVDAGAGSSTGDSNAAVQAAEAQVQALQEQCRRMELANVNGGAAAEVQQQLVAAQEAAAASEAVMLQEQARADDLAAQLQALEETNAELEQATHAAQSDAVQVRELLVHACSNQSVQFQAVQEHAAQLEAALEDAKMAFATAEKKRLDVKKQWREAAISGNQR
jgi:hypothetical protein